MIGDLRRLKAARAFVPFTIHTAGGAELRVPAVDRIAIAPAGARIVVFADDGSAILESALLVSQITVDPEASHPQAAYSQP